MRAEKGFNLAFFWAIQRHEWPILSHGWLTSKDRNNRLVQIIIWLLGLPPLLWILPLLQDTLSELEYFDLFNVSDLLRRLVLVLNQHFEVGEMPGLYVNLTVWSAWGTITNWVGVVDDCIMQVGIRKQLMKWIQLYLACVVRCLTYFGVWTLLKKGHFTDRITHRVNWIRDMVVNLMGQRTLLVLELTQAFNRDVFILLKTIGNSIIVCWSSWVLPLFVYFHSWRVQFETFGPKVFNHKLEVPFLPKHRLQRCFRNVSFVLQNNFLHFFHYFKF